MSEREVVITGIGLLTPLGRDFKENWENLKALRSGISAHPAGDGSIQGKGIPDFFLYRGEIAGIEIPDDVPRRLYNQMKFLNRGSLLGFCAAREAVSRSGVNLADIPPYRRALYIASGDFTNIGYDFMYPAVKEGTGGKWREMDFEKLNTSALDNVNPFFLLESIHNNLFSSLSAFYEFMGSNTSLASLSPCGGYAIELAYRSIKHDKADVALAVGCGSWVNEVVLYELEELGMLSKCRSGIRSFRPFDRDRDGFITGEGGAVIFLESQESARSRGADILGRIKGFGNCIEFSQGKGLGLSPRVTSRVIKLALDEACCDIEEISFIILHGSSTQKGDKSELRSVLDVLKDKMVSPPVCGMKPYTGHMGAASDIAEVIFGMGALAEGMAPATLNFEKTEKEFSGLNISASHTPCEGDLFLSVSYGIGGHSSSVVVGI